MCQLMTKINIAERGNTVPFYSRLFLSLCTSHTNRAQNIFVETVRESSSEPFLVDLL